ncbi:hypothetical protein HMSP1_61 [Sinorhizobium phage HMSP1-Susan]|nr:hypothetical protein HMSP1_61 [Sinorhizobium phage HMSP1-Susan]
MVVCRPSAAYIWSNCAAYPLFSTRKTAEPPSDEAREGTCAAWVAELVLRGQYPDTYALEGHTHANGWLVTREMCHHVRDYVDLMRDGATHVNAEQRVKLGDYIEGTYDSSTALATGVLRMRDLKYGYMIVEVFENLQLIIYTAGELMRLGFPPEIHTVELGIYQPRAWHHQGPLRLWTMTVSELWQHAQRLIDKSIECQQPNPVASPGDHCRWCDIKTQCEANAHSVYAGYQHVTSPHMRQMSTPELAAELSTLAEIVRLAKARYEAVEAEAEQRMKTGGYFPGWFMKPRKGHRKFKAGVTPETVKFVTGFEATKTEMKTPPEMEKDGADPKLIEKLAYAPDIGHKLSKVPGNYFDKIFGKPQGAGK